jgi:hypothetical protein
MKNNIEIVFYFYIYIYIIKKYRDLFLIKKSIGTVTKDKLHA